MTTRAAREAARLPLLGAPEARCSLPGRAFAESLAVLGSKTKTGAARQAVPGGGDFWGGEEHSPGVGARSAHQHLTRRICLNAANAVRVVSYATRPQGAHRSEVEAKRRPPQHEPLPGTACRAALNRRAMWST